MFLFSSPVYFLLRLPCFPLSLNKVRSASLQSLPHRGAADSDNATARHGQYQRYHLKHSRSLHSYKNIAISTKKCRQRRVNRQIKLLSQLKHNVT